MRNQSYLMLLAMSAATLCPFVIRASRTDSISSPRAVVVQLYKDFAWEAIASSEGPSASPFGEPLAEQSQHILERYFDAPLARLLARDAACQARTQGDLCTLDFNLLFASQDPAASDLEIRVAGPNRVDVSFVYPANRETVEVEYLTTRTPAGWRIKDVIYHSMGNQSLLRLLAEPPVDQRVPRIRAKPSPRPTTDA